MENNDIKTLMNMLEVVLMMAYDESLITWCGEAAPGKNQGGEYISIYQTPRSDGGYTTGRFCTCYEQDWRKLPSAVVEQAKKLFDSGKVKTTKGVNDRDADRSAGLAFTFDPIKALRFRYGGDDKSLWRFHSYVAEYKAKPQPKVGGESVKQPTPTQTTTPVVQTPPQQTVTEQPTLTFVSRDAAIQWSIDQGAYMRKETAEAEYEALKKRIASKYSPFTAKHMFIEWISAVKTMKLSVERGLIQEV